MLALAILQFAVWEAALFAAAVVLARWLGFGGARRVEEKLLAVFAIEITLESTFAAIFSYARVNSLSAYWVAAAICAATVLTPRGREAVRAAIGGLRTVEISRHRQIAGLFAVLLTPLIFLSFRPVEEADSINYLHYLIDWMANRVTPYTFATNYVAFWELSFLPAWTITRVDFFFPLLALKAVVLLSLAVWLAGREFGLRGRLLLWATFGIVLLRHLWWQSSGVPTLKNDVLHGAGFVLLVVCVARAARTRSIRRSAYALFALGAAFAAVKYTGIFEAAIAAAIVLWLTRRYLRPVPVLLAGVFVLATSGHYYLHNLLLFGNPFYPFQINLAFLHLPGTADLSNTSILYNLRNPGVWRALFLPAGGLSAMGLIFPLVLAAVPIAIFRRRVPVWVAAMVLAGWLLYFRSIYGAGVGPGDIGLVTSLNTIRYVIGVLAVSELLFIAMLARFPRAALALVVLNAATRLGILYGKLPNVEFPIALVIAVSIAAGLAMLLLRRHALVAATVALLVAGPLIDQRNHRHWLEWWDDLRTPIEQVRGSSLALLVVDDWGYFAGHIFAAGNPVHPEVRAIEAADFDAVPVAGRPRYLAALPTPGAPEAAIWRKGHAAEFARWGYAATTNGKFGAILERTLPPIGLPSDSSIDAWYGPILAGHVLQAGEITADAVGNLVRLDPQGLQPLTPSAGVTMRLLNCGDLDQGHPIGATYRRQDGHWKLTESLRSVSAVPSPAWNTSSGGGTYTQQTLSDPAGRFVRLRANNDARWLIYSASYPSNLPDDAPLTIEAMVRCPSGCSLSTAGHSPELEKRVQSDSWTTIYLTYAYQKGGTGQHYAIGLNACRRGDFFDLRNFDLRLGVFPYN